MTDPVTEARDALLRLHERGDYTEEGWAPSDDGHECRACGGWCDAPAKVDNLIALARAEAGVSVEALHRDHHPVPYHWSQSGERGTVCAGSLVGLHHRVELWPCDVERAIQTALAARSAGSGSRVGCWYEGCTATPETHNMSVAPMTGWKVRRTLPRCTETVQRGERAGEECGRRARFVVCTHYQYQGFVCGNHRRSWQPTALYFLTPVETPR